MAQPYFLLVVGALLALGNVGVVWGDCNAQVQLFLANNTFQKSNDLKKMGTGVWIISESVPRGALALQSVVAPLDNCMSQSFSPINSTALNMNSTARLSVAPPLTTPYVTTTGVASAPVSQPANWTWTQAGLTWRGVVLATDYDTYWFHYECQDAPLGVILENAVIRTRARGTDRSLPSTIQTAGEKLFKSIGFNMSTRTIMKQTNC